MLCIKQVVTSSARVCISLHSNLYINVLSISFQGMYFDRDDVALPNFSSFFLERSVKEREQAEKLLEYQNMRGGRIVLQTIAVSPKCQVLVSSGHYR